jgi:hypothetical protein
MCELNAEHWVLCSASIPVAICDSEKLSFINTPLSLLLNVHLCARMGGEQNSSKNELREPFDFPKKNQDTSQIDKTKCDTSIFRYGNANALGGSKRTPAADSESSG